MLITSHLALTLLVGKALSLDGRELLTALSSGVALDIDHLFVNTKWISDIKNFFREGTVTHGEVQQHSWLQEPVFGLIVGTAIGILLWQFFAIRWWIFPLFQAVHIFTDGFMRYEHKPLVPFSQIKFFGPFRSGSVGEWIISTVILVAIAFVL